MPNADDAEDRQIKAILLSAASLALMVLLGFAAVVAVMISMNFNLLNWME